MEKIAPRHLPPQNVRTSVLVELLLCLLIDALLKPCLRFPHHSRDLVPFARV